MTWISLLGTDFNFAQVINFEPKLENNYRIEDNFQGNAKIYSNVLSFFTHHKFILLKENPLRNYKSTNSCYTITAT